MATGGPPSGRGSEQRGGGQAGWLRPWPLVVLPLGFLLGRAPLMGALGPFPVALVAALRGSALPGAGLLALGALFGLLSRAGEFALVWPGVIGAGAALLFAFLAPVGSGRPAAAGAAAAGAALLAALPQGRLNWWELVGAGLQAAVTGALAFTFARGLAQWSDHRWRPWDGEAGLAGLLVAMGVVAGLNGAVIRAGGSVGLPLDVLAASLAVMASAWSAGSLAAAAAGLLAGVAGVLAGGREGFPLEAHAMAALAFGTAGLLAGAFRDLGRVGVVIAYVCTYLLLRAQPSQQSDPALIWAHTTAVALAAVALFALPQRWAAMTGRWVLSGVASGQVPGSGPVARSGSAAARDRVTALARVLREVQWAFARAPRPGSPEPAAAADVAAAIGQVAERVCEGCQCQLYCWGEREKLNTCGAFSDLWRLVEQYGSVSVNDIPESKLKCIHPHQLIQAFNHLHDVLAQEQQHRRQLAEARALLGEHVQNLARVMEQLAGELAEGVSAGEAAAAASPRLAVTMGAARLAKRGSLISGDSFIGVPLGTERFLVALSDGMGAGRDAAAESQRAVTMLHGLLAAGYRLEAAVQTVNSALMLRVATDWFTTLDVAVVELAGGRTDMLKLGAAPSLLKRGPHVQVIRAETPPAGILQPLPIEPEIRVLRPGDWLVLVSDGLWDRGRPCPDDGRWLVEYLAACQPSDPHVLAEAILARALAGGDGEPGDDMTVVVLRIESGGEAPAPVHRAPVPARRAPGIVAGRDRQGGAGRE